MRVGDFFNHTIPSGQPKGSTSLVSNTRVGVEIELEGVPRRNRSGEVQGWNIIGDGSLRNNGVEFVFDRPSGGGPLIKRLESFEDWVRDCKPTPICSERTSIHVHVDVRDLEWSEMWDMVLLYCVVEPFLFYICGEHRSDNIYSLSLLRGEQQASFITNLRDPSSHRDIGGDEHKYATINFGALRRFGSLEFRGHEGTIDGGRILFWINCLLSLREFVKESEFEVEQLPKLMSELGPIQFLESVFGELMSEIEVPQNVESMMFRSALLAEDILHHFNYSNAASEVASIVSGDLLGELYDTTRRDSGFSVSAAREVRAFNNEVDSLSNARFSPTQAVLPMFERAGPSERNTFSYDQVRVALAGVFTSSELSDIDLLNRYFTIMIFE